MKVLRNLVNIQKVIQSVECKFDISINRMIQLDSNRSEFSEHMDPQFFIDLMPRLETRISTLIQQLKKPLAHILPVQFQAHLQNAKSNDKIDQEWIENFKDVVALKVQGRINTSLMRIAQQLNLEFGGQIIAWLDLLCCFAQNEKYHQHLRIWQINDAYKTCLHLPIGQYEKNRHFRRLAKHDINLTKKLISTINQLISAKQNEDGSKKTSEQLLNKVQLNYKLHQESNRKVVQFLRSESAKCLQFFGQKNLLYPQKKSLTSTSSNSKSKICSKSKQKGQIQKQKMITDFSVQMMDTKNMQLYKKIVGQDEKPTDPQKISEFDTIFFNMAKEQGELKQNMYDLRVSFNSTKSRILKTPQSIYSNIFIAYSYIQYQEFHNRIESAPFSTFENPFIQHNEINYENNDYELFEEFQADRISATDSEENSEDDSLDSVEKRDFYNEQDDGYDMDEEDREVQRKAFRNQKLFGGNQWVFNHRDQEPFSIKQQMPKSFKTNQDQYSRQQETNPYIALSGEMITQMIDDFNAMIICPNPTPMPVAVEEYPTELTQEQQSKIKQIFHGKSRHQAMDIIKATPDLSDICSKQKINDLVSKMTRKRIRNDEGKLIYTYFLNENDKENHSKHQNTSKASITARNENSQSDTDFQESAIKVNDSDYKPRVNFPIDSKSRISSQRIMNMKPTTVNDQEQQKSQSSSIQNQAVSITVSQAMSQKTRKEFMRESKLWNTETMTNPPISRLRPRSSKPNYNLEQLLNSGKKEEEDIEI